MPQLRTPAGVVSDPMRPLGDDQWEGGYRLLNVAALGMLAFFLFLVREADLSAGQTDAIVLWGLRIDNGCIYRHLTGSPCPGCGITRALVALLDGRLAQASALHPSALWVGAWLAVQFVVRFVVVAAALRPRLLWVVDLVLSLATFVAAMYAPVIYTSYTVASAG